MLSGSTFALLLHPAGRASHGRGKLHYDQGLFRYPWAPADNKVLTQRRAASVREEARHILPTAKMRSIGMGGIRTSCFQRHGGRPLAQSSGKDRVRFGARTLGAPASLAASRHSTHERAGGHRRLVGTIGLLVRVHRQVAALARSRHPARYSAEPE